ncbi:MAG: VOC family protein [Pseudomonadota bacterium]
MTARGFEEPDTMCNTPLFLRADPYQDDVLALPVVDIDRAAAWYGPVFALSEVARRDAPVPGVIMARDGVQIGFAVTGGDPEQDGAAIRVADIARAHAELVATGAKPGAIKTETRDGREERVFFVIAPDGLCYYFYQPI